MRTIFEDTTAKAQVEETRNRGNESKYSLPFLWLIAMIFLAGTLGVNYWVVTRPAVQAPRPPVSLDDEKQTAEAFNNFNRFIGYGNYPEAEILLSTAAKQKLADEKKSLAESLLGSYKDRKIVGADRTNSVDRSVPGRVREDCLYKFIDNNDYTKIEQKIISLYMVNENNRLVIDGWDGIKADEPKKDEPKK
jgi:hypothetical protein